MKHSEPVVLNAKLEEFQKLLEFMPDAMVIADSKGGIVIANSQAQKLFGYSKEELLHQPIEILIPQRFREAHVRNRNDYMGSPHLRPMGAGLDLLAKRKDGSEFPVEISLGPVKSAEGAFVMAAVRDISERKRGESKFQKLLELAPDSIIIVDHHGKIIFSNSQTEKLLGYKREELLNQSIETLVPHRFRSAHAGHREKYMKEPHIRPMGVGFNLYARHKDGTEIPVEISLGPMESPEGTLVMAALRDVTVQRQAEKILKQSKAELEEQVLKRTEEIRKLQKEILEISETEQKRIGQDLHDGPSQTMTAVGYKSQLLTKMLSEKSPAEAAIAAEIVQFVSGAMDQLRGLARGLYPVELERHGLGPALEELALVTQAQSKIPCRVKREGPLNLKNDEAIQLYRISQEAINNAIKHARPKNISIRVSEKGGRVLLTIMDDGIGISTDKAGKGMGLDIMKYRAGMISAALEVKPRPEGGTEVSCTLDVSGDAAKP